MNGLMLEEPRKISSINLSENEPLQTNEVEIRVIYGGICGSDLGTFKGLLPHAMYPVIPGHEILGEVTQAGCDTSLEIGQRVVVHPNTYCGTCEKCVKGKTNICPEKKSLGINVNGGFRETFIVEEKYAIPVPKQLTNERAILIEPLSVIVHALEKVTIDKDTTIGVIGCGTEGLLTVALASYLGGKITAIDINDTKLKEVKELYPTITVQHPSEIAENQFDIVVEVAGVKQSFEQAVDIVKPGGTIVAVGLPKSAELPVVKIVREEIQIKGSIIYDAKNDFEKSIQYLLDANFYVEPIISEILPIEQYEDAYAKALTGKYRKIILKF